MTVRAVVFDMDGVLVDAREWHYESLNKALGHFGLCISRFDHLVTYDGLPTRDKLEMLSMEHGLPRQLHSFINSLKQKYTMEVVSAQCRPTFQHEYALARLQSEGYLLGLASNSIRATIEAMMQQTALIDYFKVMLSNQDVDRGKPHPDIYLKAIDQLGVLPQEVLVVEDNEKGVRAAREAGANVLAVRDPFEVTYSAIAREIAYLEEVPA